VRLLKHSFQIFEGKMKVATQTQLQRQCRIDPALKFSQKSQEVFAIVGVAVVGVGGGHGMSNAIRRGHAAHLNGDFPGLGTVVNFGQKMAVDVDHETIFDWSKLI
jgi:hypothetical protein